MDERTSVDGDSGHPRQAGKVIPQKERSCPSSALESSLSASSVRLVPLLIPKVHFALFAGGFYGILLLFKGMQMFANEHAVLMEDLRFRWHRVQQDLAAAGVDGMFVISNVNLVYLTGRVFMGAFYLPVTGEPLFFIRRPEGWTGDRVLPIRKIEQAPELIGTHGLVLPKRIAVEEEEISHAEFIRISKLFPDAQTVSASGILRRRRAVKSPFEIEIMRRAGRGHADAYSRFPKLFRPGMTDRDFAVELETELLRSGSLGMFRVHGQSMEIFIGLVLTGDNAGAPSPYDFALGGKGEHPSIPIGETGLPIRSGTTVLADLSWNTAGYLTDMTRVFACGEIPAEAHRLHRAAIAIETEVAALLKPGASCEALYELALKRAAEAGGSDCFMGASQKAKFIGHGTGLVINELPVLGARSKDVLEEGMCIALEPKFVIPGVGAVGVEDTYLVTADGGVCLTDLTREILPLC